MNIIKVCICIFPLEDYLCILCKFHTVWHVMLIHYMFVEYMRDITDKQINQNF